MIECENIKLNYGKINVLKGVNLKINKGEFISIVGASGVGKSTLLHILGTLEKPTSGTISINNNNPHGFNEKKLSEFRNKKIGFVFQFHNLLNEFTALENICLPAYISGTKKNIAISKAKDLMEKLDIINRINHRPSELSGGEQQRLAVARALINDPDYVLADEPSGNLDSKNAAELHNLFLMLNKELNQTLIIVTHNNEFANCAGRKLFMKDGVIL